MSLLEVKGLVKTYRRRRVVDGVSFCVEGGSIVALLGPNGAGKTTTFSMTVGLIRTEKGTIRFLGADVTRLPMYQRSRRGMGYLSQEPSVFRRLSVEDNILAILETLPLRRPVRRKRAQALLAELGLTHLAKSRADTLSGGETRRLEITRALVTSPKLLLLDEPFSGVDPIAVQEIRDILLGLRERGIAVLLTDHNVRDTLSTTDQAFILHRGQILRGGPPSDLIDDPQVREIYLGHSFDLPESGVSEREIDALERASGGSGPRRHHRNVN